MQAVEGRSAVLNPSLGRTSSAFEAVEMRRRLARKTDRIAVEASAHPRAKRTTAQLYVDEGLTVDGAAAAQWPVNRLLTGIFLSATVAIMAAVIANGIS